MALRRPLAGLAVAALALAGCTTTPAATATPTLQPSYSCTPEAGGDSYSCSQAEYEQMQAKDELYAEAKSVYERSIQLRNDALTKGVNDVGPLSEIAQGSALESFTEDFHSEERLQGGELTARWIQRLPGYSKLGSSVALEACADSSSGILIYPDGTSKRGFIGIERTYYQRVDERLLMIEIESKLVDSC